MTRLQRDLLDFIRHYQRDTCGVSPSFDEMRQSLGLASKSGVHRLLISLEEQGLIHRQRDRARRIEVLCDAENRPKLTQTPRARDFIPATHPEVVTVPIYSMWAFPDQFPRRQSHDQRAHQITDCDGLVHTGSVTG